MKDMSTLEELKSICGAQNPMSDTLVHLLHVFEGYREYIKGKGSYDRPYHPGSARDVSFQQGIELARNDMK